MKKSQFNILILDDNRFFSQSLVTLLQTQCLQREATLTFLTRHNAHRADLMILSDEIPPQMWMYHVITMNTKSAVILIRDAAQRSFVPRIVHETGILWRRDSAHTTLQLIEQVLINQSGRPSTDIQFNFSALTFREYQVLSVPAQGAQPAQVASQLGLSIKTISAHKCNVMRKFGFTRNQELYYWLRQGGLLTSKYAG